MKLSCAARSALHVHTCACIERYLVPMNFVRDITHSCTCNVKYFEFYTLVMKRLMFLYLLDGWLANCIIPKNTVKHACGITTDIVTFFFHFNLPVILLLQW